MDTTIVDVIKQISVERFSKKPTPIKPTERSKSVNISLYRQKVKQYMKVWIASMSLCKNILQQTESVELPYFGIFSKMLQNVYFTPSSKFKFLKWGEGIIKYNSSQNCISKVSIPLVVGGNLQLNSNTVDGILYDISDACVEDLSDKPSQSWA